ncbi:MAG: hypothetical protein JEY99_17495 [Spirochaetales bacterium]|nr:hypothetical protein [Spirochaetales bacterium]
MIRFRNGMEEAKDAVNGWWELKTTGKPVIQMIGRRENPVFTLPEPKPSSIHDFWTNPEVVIPRILNQMGRTWYGGVAFPVLYPVSGRIVSITCKYLGAPNLYIDENTTWSRDIIESWERCPPLEFNPLNEWWIITERLMEACASAIEEYELACFMGLPDLNGPTEVLSGLRNPEKLCMDLILEPENVKQAARKVQEGWFEAFRRSSAIAGRFGPYFTWMGVWSEIPSIDLQSDFSCLISPDMFAEFILPLIREQIAFFPRTIFHLDGPGMIRHLDHLLSLPDLKAVQWIPGAGAGRSSDWIDLLKRIQEGGKGVFVYCDPDEVEILSSRLDATGLMMVVRGDIPEREAMNILDKVGK